MKPSALIVCLLLVVPVTKAQIPKYYPLEYADSSHILETANQLTSIRGQYLQVRVLTSTPTGRGANDIYFAVSWLPDTLGDLFQLKGVIEPTFERAIPDTDGEGAIVFITSGAPTHRTTLKYLVYSELVEVYESTER